MFGETNAEYHARMVRQDEAKEGAMEQFAGDVLADIVDPRLPGPLTPREREEWQERYKENRREQQK
jgi:hypothetical protein